MIDVFFFFHSVPENIHQAHFPTRSLQLGGVTSRPAACELAPDVVLKTGVAARHTQTHPTNVKRDLLSNPLLGVVTGSL